jgi:hypothetical protein
MANMPNNRKTIYDARGNSTRARDYAKDAHDRWFKDLTDRRPQATTSKPSAVQVVAFVIVAIAVIAFSVFVAQHLVAGPH